MKTSICDEWEVKYYKQDPVLTKEVDNKNIKRKKDSKARTITINKED